MAEFISRLRRLCGREGGRNPGVHVVRAPVEDDSTDETDSSDTGATYFNLLVDGTWVHRQVDSFRLNPEGYTRRHVSLDLTVPERVERAGQQAFLPVGILRKRVIQGLDASHNGNSLPVLTSRDNGAITIALIDHLIDGVGFPPEDTEAVKSELHALVDHDGADRGGCNSPSTDVLRRSLEKLTGMTADAETKARLLVTYAQLFADNFLLIVVIPAELVSQRIVVKFALDQPFEVKFPWRSKLDPLTISYPEPAGFFWSGASYHVEVDFPPDLVVVHVAAEGDDAAVEDGSAIANSPALGTSRSHVVFKQPGDDDKEGGPLPGLRIRTIPGPYGIRKFTWWAAVVVTALVVASVPVRIWDLGVSDTFSIPSTVAPVVLVGPALLLSWIGRSREHDVVSSLLSPLRSVLMACSLVLVLLAGMAAVPVDVWMWHTMWAVIYGLTVIITVLVGRLYWSYHMSEPPKSGQPGTMNVRQVEGDGSGVQPTRPDEAAS